ncbi:MAG: TlpA disulfide reductase family protein [Chitinophagaceae bacterium]
MKRLSFLLIGAIVGNNLLAQSSGFTLTGDISNLKAPVEWVYLNYMINNQRISDSVLVKQDSYHFKGNVTEAVQAQLHIRYKAGGSGTNIIPVNSKRDYAIVFLEPGNITVASVDSFANVVVANSKADAEYRKLQEMAKPYDTRLAALYKDFSAARKSKNDTAMKRLEAQIDSIDGEANEKVYGGYVKNNLSSPLAIYALRNWAGYEMDVSKIEPVFKSLPAATRQSPSGKEMQEKIVTSKKTAIGQLALDFIQDDTLGKPVALRSFRGKYLLVDFWASWCGPCRAENPNLVTTFNKYKGKGFQVLSVSLDRPGAKDKWLKAIQDDQLKWWHVSDLKFWDNAVARQYGIEAIPQNLLLDPTGKIIAKNLRGEALGEKLATIYPD